MKLGIVVNDLMTEHADYTSSHIAMNASNMGHEVFYMGVGDFAFGPGDKVYAHARQPSQRPHSSRYQYLHSMRTRHAETVHLDLAELDILLLRNDPAADVNARPWARLAGVNFGRLAKQQGVIVLNDPDGLTQAVNKMYLLKFPPELRPATLISRDPAEIKRFIKDSGGYGVIKPLSGSGGRNVFLISPHEQANINQMIEAVETEGYVIVQEYLPEAAKGDTRLFLVNGEPFQVEGEYAAIHRVRRNDDGDMRSNITAGAVAEKAVITNEMLRLAEMVRPGLIHDGMFMVGLDIVDNKILEINVFSPGGLLGAEMHTGINFAGEIVHMLERKVDYLKQYDNPFDNVEMATF
jgi:glutathione synthase